MIPGQWYEDSIDERCLAFGSDDVVYRDGITTIDVKPKAIKRFTHLPDCDGWDWQPPKPLKVEVGKWYRCRNGSVQKITGWWIGRIYPFTNDRGDTWTEGGRWILGGTHDRDLVEEIPEPEPKWRPFANADEFKPYRDRWWRYKNDHPTNIRPPGAYDVHGFVGHKWERCLEILEFEGGTPFGIEVTE